MADTFRITRPGINITALTTSAARTLPLNEVSEGARRVRVQTETSFAYVKVGTDAALSAGLADILVTPNEATILHTRGQTNIAAITRAGTVQISVVPIED